MPARYGPCLVSPLGLSVPTARIRGPSCIPGCSLSRIYYQHRAIVFCHIRIQQVFRHIQLSGSSRFPLLALYTPPTTTRNAPLNIYSPFYIACCLPCIVCCSARPHLPDTCTAYSFTPVQRTGPLFPPSSRPFLGPVICFYSTSRALVVCHPVLILQSTSRLIRSRTLFWCASLGFETTDIAHVIELVRKVEKRCGASSSTVLATLSDTPMPGRSSDIRLESPRDCRCLTVNTLRLLRQKKTGAKAIENGSLMESSERVSMLSVGKGRTAGDLPVSS